MDTKKKLTSTFIQGLSTPSKRVEIYDTVVTGMVLRITKTGFKSFAYRYWYEGQSRQITIGKFGDISLAEAREKTREYKRMIADGIDPSREKMKRKEESPKTFVEVINDYKEKHLPTLKASTRTDYTYRINHLLKGAGKKDVKSRGFDGNRYIKDMKRYEVLDYLNSIAKTSPTQAKRLQAILSGIFKHAKDREWISNNIASEISLKIKATKKSKLRKWQNTDLTDSQIIVLWNAFEKHSEPVGSLFKILLLLGQRSGETRLMKWEDLDLEKKLWTIPAPDTKNGKTHFVPLTDTAIDIIVERKSYSNGRFVFESPINRNNPLGSPQKSAQRIRDTYGVSDFNIHSLRTTVATRLAGLGTPPQVLSKILNHKKPGEGSLITEIYNKYDYENEKRTSLQRWCSELLRILDGDNAKILELRA